MKIQGAKGYTQERALIIGEGNRLDAGNYICKILGVKCTNDKNGNPMLVIQYDIAEGEYKDYYQNLHKSKIETNKEAKYQGTKYQGMTGKSLKIYKGILTSLEKSNNIKLDGENGFDSEELKGKVFLGRFGEEEYLGDDNQIKTSTKLRYITSTDKKDLSILDKKVLKDIPRQQANDSFYSVETNVEDDMLPF